MLHDVGQIEMAFEFVSSGQPCEHEALLDLDTGDIHYRSECGDDETPKDIESRNCLSIPHKNELGLGLCPRNRFAISRTQLDANPAPNAAAASSSRCSVVSRKCKAFPGHHTRGRARVGVRKRSDS